MQNSDPLVWYGTALILVCGAFIFIPYLRGRSDLLTSWNVFLVGVIIFAGIGCYEVKWGAWTWPMLQWFQPTRKEVDWYIMATTAFMAALIVGYYYNPLARAVGHRVFRHWPNNTVPMMTFVVVLCLGMVMVGMLATKIFFFGLVASQVSHKAAVFAAAFSFLLWDRNRKNVVWLGMLLAVFAWAGLFTMLVSSGRRLLLSVFLAPIICAYWTHVRYWRPARCFTALAVAAALVVVASSAYSSIRWFSVGRNAQDRTLKNVVKQVGKIHQGSLFEALFSNKLHYFSQWNTHYSLLTKHYVDNGQLKPKALNTLRFMLAYPIPRSIYPSKPEVIGVTMVRDVVGYPTTNWGLGIAGHGAYEGGVPALILYALLISFGLRVIDDAMREQPSNPFLIAAFVSASPHILSIPRGDFGIMFNETLEAYAFMVALAIACRFLFGTERTGSPSISPWTLPNVQPTLSHFPHSQRHPR